MELKALPSSTALLTYFNANPFNGIESYVVAEIVNASKYFRNPFNGIERMRTASMVQTLRSGRRIHSMELKGYKVERVCNT